MKAFVLAGVLFTAVTAATAQPVDFQDWNDVGLDWRQYGKTREHGSVQPFSLLSKATVPYLAKAWEFPTGDAVTAGPAIVDGVVYVGSWDGNFYALDADDGTLVWKIETDCNNRIVPVPARCLAPGQTPPDRRASDGGLITTAATVEGNRVYFGSGKTLWSVNKDTGAVYWKRIICGNPEQPSCEADATDFTRFFGGAVIIGNHIWIGSAVDGAPNQRGGMHVVNKWTGKIVHRFDIDVAFDASGKIVRDARGQTIGLNRGCGNELATVTYVPELDLVYFGTQECDQPGGRGPLHDSFLAVDAKTFAVRWQYDAALDSPNKCNNDWGSTPVVLRFAGERDAFIGSGAKNGTFYVWNARTGQLRWKRNVAYGGTSGGFIASPAFDGERIYIATGYGDLGRFPVCEPDDPTDTPLQDPSLHVFDARTGAIRWQYANHYSYSQATIANDVLFDGWAGLGQGASVRMFDKRSGALLRELPTAGSVNSAVVPMLGSIYFGVGNSYDGVGSAVQAWRLRL